MRLPGHFDLIAPYYDRVFRFLGSERLMELLQAQPSERILDIGGGTGRVSHTFGDDYIVVVCDPSWSMLREARRKRPGLSAQAGAHRRMTACRGLAERLPFADGAFHRIVMVDTFHHLRDPRVAASEMVRVLHPDGRLVIEEPDIRRWSVKLAALGERLLLMRSRFYSAADLGCVFERAGAHIVAAEEGDDFNVRLAMRKSPWVRD